MRRTDSIVPPDWKHPATDSETITLALQVNTLYFLPYLVQTLGSFDFTTNTNVKNFDAYLEELVRDCVIKFLDRDEPAIRKHAAHTSGGPMQSKFAHFQPHLLLLPNDVRLL